MKISLQDPTPQSLRIIGDIKTIQDFKNWWPTEGKETFERYLNFTSGKTSIEQEVIRVFCSNLKKHLPGIDDNGDFDLAVMETLIHFDLADPSELPG
jgi:hypothetical protein